MICNIIPVAMSVPGVASSLKALPPTYSDMSNLGALSLISVKVTVSCNNKKIRMKMTIKYEQAFYDRIGTKSIGICSRCFTYRLETVSIFNKSWLMDTSASKTHEKFRFSKGQNFL